MKQPKQNGRTDVIPHHSSERAQAGITQNAMINGISTGQSGGMSQSRRKLHTKIVSIFRRSKPQQLVPELQTMKQFVKNCHPLEMLFFVSRFSLLP
jgi:hypothetical protein